MDMEEQRSYIGTEQVFQRKRKHSLRRRTLGTEKDEKCTKKREVKRLLRKKQKRMVVKEEARTGLYMM
jgi:hypothetical protein